MGRTDLQDGPHRADVFLHSEHRVAPIDPRIFGGFLEHLGRAVYGGVFDPGSPRSDERGFRTDVLDALRPLAMPVVRYPGGNFVSAYDWRDGVGPLEHRPRRLDVAWHSVETNRFGTDEFVEWCRLLGAAPMLAVNLGTGTPDLAASLVEYCNRPAGTVHADRRVANGHAEPYRVALWCLGNEMDGPWQAGHVPASVYAERALVASQLMKGVDPSIETVACGSSSRNMPTYLEWDRTVLERCWDGIDYLSAHRYSRNAGDDTASFLAEGVVVDQILDDYRGLLAYMRGRKRSSHQVHLSFDEWNVWYRERGQDGGGQEAPPLLEEVYNLEDALVCAQYIHAFVRNCDIVKVACLAQIVNVIAPLLTRPDDLLVQSIYWPFRLLRQEMSGDALRCAVRAPELATRRGDTPVIDVAATVDDAGNQMCVSLVSRDPARPVDVHLNVADRAARVEAVSVLTGPPKATNTWEERGAVAPKPHRVTETSGGLSVTLPAPSLVVMRLSTQPR